MMGEAGRIHSGARSGVRAGLPGFTLLEVVVAVAIFAVVAALAWGGLDRIARAKQVIDEQSRQLLALQQAIGQLERDLRQAAPRPVRDGSGLELPALLGGGDGIELTRYVGGGGWDRQAPALERVGWRCAEGRLQRLRWVVLDRTATTQVDVEDRVEGVGQCRWRFLTGGVVLERWPMSGDAEPPERLPAGVELRFELDGEGEYRRVLELPAASGAP